MSRPLLTAVACVIFSTVSQGNAKTTFVPTQLPLVAAQSVVAPSDANPSVWRVQATAADQAWRALGENASPDQIMTFLEKFPRSIHDTEAKRQLLKALETQAEDTSAAAQPQVDAAQSDAEVPVEAAVEPAALPVATPPADDGVVRFTVPLFHGDSQVVGKSLEQLIAGSPLFAPVEGLPEEYWKEQTCKNCHEWQQANLCEQANFYLTEKGAASLTKQHPYGGSFKENLRVWAVGDCQ